MKVIHYFSSLTFCRLYDVVDRKLTDIDFSTVSTCNTGDSVPEDLPPVEQAPTQLPLHLLTIHPQASHSSTPSVSSIDKSEHRYQHRRVLENVYPFPLMEVAIDPFDVLSFASAPNLLELLTPALSAKLVLSSNDMLRNQMKIQIFQDLCEYLLSEQPERLCDVICCIEEMCIRDLRIRYPSQYCSDNKGEMWEYRDTSRASNKDEVKNVVDDDLNSLSDHDSDSYSEFGTWRSVASVDGAYHSSDEEDDKNILPPKANSGDETVLVQSGEETMNVRVESGDDSETEIEALIPHVDDHILCHFALSLVYHGNIGSSLSEKHSSAIQHMQQLVA